MTSKITGFKIPTRYAKFSICVLAFGVLMFAGLLPASAAVIGVQPGVLKALGQPAATINSTPSPDLLLVRSNRGGGGRSFRGGGGSRRVYRGGGSRRVYRGGGSRRVYRGRGRRTYRGYSIPLYAYGAYYSYRSYYGRCEYWHRRCVANWGYRNPDYYGCMRYQGCL
jgi:hypothetical protein